MNKLIIFGIFLRRDLRFSSKFKRYNGVLFPIYQIGMFSFTDGKWYYYVQNSQLYKQAMNRRGDFCWYVR